MSDIHPSASIWSVEMQRLIHEAKSIPWRRLDFFFPLSRVSPISFRLGDISIGHAWGLASAPD